VSPILRLSDCGDTLSIAELCLVLGISQRKYYELKAHHITLVPTLPYLHRFSKVKVQEFLDRNGLQQIRKAG